MWDMLTIHLGPTQDEDDGMENSSKKYCERKETFDPQPSKGGYF